MRSTCCVFFSIFSCGRTWKKRSSLSKWPTRRWETRLNLTTYRSATTCARWDSSRVLIWCLIYVQDLLNGANPDFCIQLHRTLGFSETKKTASLCSVFGFCRLQNLQVKMRGHGIPWSKLLMVLLVFAAGFIAHDIRSQGSFTGQSGSVLFTRQSHTALCLFIYNGCLFVFQIPPQPGICAVQGSRLFLSRPGAK